MGRFENPAGAALSGAAARRRPFSPMAELQTTTKKELINRISDRTGQTKAVVKEILQSFLDEIIDELALGNRLEFREFGVFEVRERAARRAQNPRTLEKVSVPAKRVVKFKVGRAMRQRVCEEDAPARPPAEAAPAPAAPAPQKPQQPRPSRNSPF
jgi:integration host factor subunit beta